jgi:WD40 repeat protein
MLSKKRQVYICEDCEHKWPPAHESGQRASADTSTSAEQPLRIFLSYGHDDNVDLVLRIKAGLERRGHDVWFDKNPQKEKGIRPGDDWRRAITDGIACSNQVLSFLSKHSTRVPGVCIDEIGIALGVKGGNIRTILLEGEKEVKSPPSISHIQWVDMHDWKKQRDAGGDAWETWYKEKFDEIVSVVESDESRRFAGEIERLSKLLKPITSDSRIRELYAKPFIGREWMFKAVEDWRARRGDDARLFWVMGDPGVGKSAFSANLTHYHKGEVIAVHFCEWNKPDQRDARRVVRNIAFQLAARLPDYRKHLLTLPEIGSLDGKDAQDLFDYLLATPLQQGIDGGRERYLIVIDALDEANENQRNPLVDMLAQNARRLPEWLGILITSRPEREVKTPLQGLAGLEPLVLETRSEENQEDIREYLREELEEELAGRDAGAIVEAILEKSEGVFLYVEYVCAQLRDSVLSLDRLEEFPDGLAGIYVQYFERQFPDIAVYKATVRHAIGVIAAAREPLTPEQLGRVLDWHTYERRDLVDSMGAIFREIDGKLQPFHKSLVDWLVDEERAGYYAVSTEEGHKQLADAGWREYSAGVQTMDVYLLKYLPTHLANAERGDNLAALLQDLAFLEAKVVAGFAFGLPSDFAKASRVVLTDHPERKLLPLLDEAIRRDIHFIARHAADYPQALFQCLWNSCWWFDCPDAAGHYVEPEGGWQGTPHWDEPGAKLHALLERWRAARERQPHTGRWLRLGRPPRIHLGTSQEAVFRVHKHWVNNVAISPGGDCIAAGSNDNTVRVWDVRSGAEAYQLGGHASLVNSVSFSPDGNCIATGSSDNTVRVWDVRSRSEKLCLKGHGDSVNSAAWSHDGTRIVSGSKDGTTRVWDVQSGEHLCMLEKFRREVKCVAFSADDSRIVSCEYKTVSIWDAHSGQELTCIGWRKGGALGVAWSHDGSRIFTGSDDDTVRVWDVISGTEALLLRGHTDTVRSVASSLDGTHIISGSDDNTVRMWDAQSGAELLSLEGHTACVSSVCPSHDGTRIVSGSHDGTVRVWDVTAGRKLLSLNDHGGRIQCVTYSPDGTLVASGARDKTLRLWDSRTGRESASLRGPMREVESVAFSPDGTRLSSGTPGTEPHYAGVAYVWELSVSRSNEIQHRLSRRLSRFCGDVVSQAFSPDGTQLACGRDDGTVDVWDLVRGLHLRSLRHHEYVRYGRGVTSVSFSPDGTRIAGGGADAEIRVWDAQTGTELCVMSSHKGSVVGVCYSPDGNRIVSTSLDNTVRVWDVHTGTCIEMIQSRSDTSAIAAGPGTHPFRAFRRDDETVIEDVVTGAPVAWFSEAVNHITAHPTESEWIGGIGNHLLLLGLEGDCEE